VVAANYWSAFALMKRAYKNWLETLSINFQDKNRKPANPLNHFTHNQGVKPYILGMRKK
jgi:hypothetical protein